MSVKYHISPTSGRPNKCSATKSCPFGGEKDHYPTKDAAREAYETQMASHTFGGNVEGYSSPFGARETVRSKTAWAYDDIVATHGGFRHLKSAHPDLEFRKAPSGELVVTGPAKKVEAYIQEPGGEAKDINLSLSRLKSLDNKGKKVNLDGSNTSSERVHSQPPAGSVDEDLYEDFLASGGWEAALNEPKTNELSDVELDPDDDWTTIKCDDCGNTLSNCTCDSCSDCGAMEGEDHEMDCSSYKPAPKAYSWD